MNHLYSPPELMMGIVMFVALCAVAGAVLALALYSAGEDDVQ